ncbi:hypothetical protein DPMN_014701 [Dreissena polymorpha]|uniref:Secreted protein n=1 Tax=Dreissena polymorpha TaxID=45954 RepID=A0A9D4N9P9_DREPO|nr:hypothetical protein DPMN_014701 [Dreissena polymorpha]
MSLVLRKLGLIIICVQCHLRLDIVAHKQTWHTAVTIYRPDWPTRGPHLQETGLGKAYIYRQDWPTKAYIYRPDLPTRGPHLQARLDYERPTFTGKTG